jgi:hypothetical protein
VCAWEGDRMSKQNKQNRTTSEARRALAIIRQAWVGTTEELLATCSLLSRYTVADLRILAEEPTPAV